MKEILPTPDVLRVKDYKVGTILWVKWNLKEGCQVHPCEELSRVGCHEGMYHQTFLMLGSLFSQEAQQVLIRGRYGASIVSVHEISYSELLLFTNFNVTPEFNSLIKKENK